VNAGAEGNISGFHLDRAGRLTALPNATLPLSGAAVAPAQISFAPDGDKLVVTEKGSNRISVYHVTQRGKASGPVVSDSAAPTPFGFEFDHHGNLIVSEAVGGAPNASVTSAYRINADGTLSVISAAVPTNQTAACWVAISSDGRFAYVTNTGSGSVSGYTIMRDGAISLDNATAGLTGAGSMPIDASVAGHHLYVLNAGSDTITSFMVNRDGSLTHLGATGDLPASVAGLATR
jgi:6-phosphogluconolactonase (cycloisomerase 2 family)